MNTVLHIAPLGFPWETSDPFLFCVHHEDHYPAGDDQLGVSPALLKGRALGSDFTVKDGFRMYHGEHVPGFPAHPHRGFETVTIARQGFIDHSDSLGAAGRFGAGDVQWMTAGRGVQHCEMFPLLDRNQPNTTELFQIWLNLPKAKKMAPAHFAMLWKEDIPVVTKTDENGKKTVIDIIAGSMEGIPAPPPAPDSWAANTSHEVAIWTIRMEPGARITLPAASALVNRRLYYYKGKSLTVAGTSLPHYHVAVLQADQSVLLENGNEESCLLLLQGQPIGEPVVQHGPFVMNTAQEIQDTFNSYYATQFGGWPWPQLDHVHGADQGRFALYADGTRVEK